MVRHPQGRHPIRRADLGIPAGTALAARRRGAIDRRRDRRRRVDRDAARPVAHRASSDDAGRESPAFRAGNRRAAPPHDRTSSCTRCGWPDPATRASGRRPTATTTACGPRCTAPASAYAFAATKRRRPGGRATKAFEALRFLGEVTQGGPHPPPPRVRGPLHPAGRGPDPNVHDSPERDRAAPAAGTAAGRSSRLAGRSSADGKWYLEERHQFRRTRRPLLLLRRSTTTSSPKTDDEKRAPARARGARSPITCSTTTSASSITTASRRAGASSIPASLNHDLDWWRRARPELAEHAVLPEGGRARHRRPEVRTRRATLVEQHGYGVNVLIPKTPLRPRRGQPDRRRDGVHELLQPRPLREGRRTSAQRYLLAFSQRFANEQPEMNPLFNFLYAAVAPRRDVRGRLRHADLSPAGDWLEDAVDTLQRFPLDRVDWSLENSHRMDIVPLPTASAKATRACGYRVNGKVLPIDERYVGHWNHDPWRLDQNGDGRTLGDGAVVPAALLHGPLPRLHRGVRGRRSRSCASRGQQSARPAVRLSAAGNGDPARRPACRAATPTACRALARHARRPASVRAPRWPTPAIRAMRVSG